MIVHLTPDQKALVRDAIASGRLHGEEDAMREALARWERRERARAEILASVCRGKATRPCALSGGTSH
jgi:Arc/MetJ-type ribon-helix-helix transcriptional regulator